MAKTPRRTQAIRGEDGVAPAAGAHGMETARAASGGPADGGGASGGSLPRRDFLKVAGAQAGLLVAGHRTLESVVAAELPRSAPAINGKSYDVAVVGAGGWGSFTAYWLRRMGAKVLLIDAYGPGNSRATSGDETRGVRTSYGDRPHGEQWMRWASRAAKQWKSWDDEWGRDLKMRLFVTTGDFIFRNEWENFTKTTRDLFVKVGIPHEVVPVEDVRREYPIFDLRDITVCLHEPDAGVVRARRACQCATEVFLKLGGELKVIRAYPAMVKEGKMDDLVLEDHDTVKAGQYVFALGPWMPKTFPGILGPRMRTPMGQVCYFATPVADERYTYPNLPSYNFPGVTGWPTLPFDSRGFRVRGGTNIGGAARGGGAGGAVPRDSTAGRAGGAAAPPATGAAAGGARGGGAAGRAGGGGGAGGGGAAARPPVPPRQQDPDLSDRFVDLDYQARARNFLAERFPGLKDAPLNETRACHYEQSITRNFIIDKHPEMANVWLAGGGSAEGFKFSPVVGEYVARRVLGKDKEPELAKGFRIPDETYETATGTAGRPGDAE